MTSNKGSRPRRGRKKAPTAQPPTRIRIVDDPKTTAAVEAQLDAALLQQSIPLRDALQWYAAFQHIDELTRPLLTQHEALSHALRQSQRGKAFVKLTGQLAEITARLHVIDQVMKERFIEELRFEGFVGFGVPSPIRAASTHVAIEPILWPALDVDWERGTAKYDTMSFIDIRVARLALLHEHEVEAFAAISLTDAGDGYVTIEELSAEDKADLLAEGAAEERDWRERPMWALPKRSGAAPQAVPERDGSAGDSQVADGPLAAEALERARAAVEKPHGRSGPKGFQAEIAKIFADLKEAGVITATTSKARAAEAVHGALVTQSAASEGGEHHRASTPTGTALPKVSTVRRAMWKQYADHFGRD